MYQVLKISLSNLQTDNNIPITSKNEIEEIYTSSRLQDYIES